MEEYNSASTLPQVMPSSDAAASTNHHQSRRKKYLLAAGALLVVGSVGAAIAAFSSSSAAAPAPAAASAMITGTAQNGGGGFLNLQVPTEDSSALRFDIPSSSIDQSFIVHATFDKGTVNADGKVETERSNPAGDADQIVFRFQLSENKKKMHVVREDYITRTSDKDLAYAVEEGIWPGYVTSLDVQNVTTDKSYVVDAMPLVSEGFFVASWLKKEHTFIKPSIVPSDTRAFVDNANVLVEYQAGEQTYRVFFSLMRLPEIPMNARVADDRVGFFALKYKDLGEHASHKSSSKQTDDIDRQITIINRRRLELTKDGSGVKKQILYYIDPSVPAKWRPYFVQGVELWKKAFAEAGFPNAIRAVLPTDADFPADYHVGDLRYNTISIMMSENVYALGPSVVDPRSGEILHADITFSHGWISSWVGGIENESPFLPGKSSSSVNATTQSIPRKNSFRSKNSFQCHRSSSEEESIQRVMAREFTNYQLGYVPEETIGAAFRETVMHEVGHTLGLRHNFIASGERTQEQLLDSVYTKQFGTTASVMDYVPTNIWSSMTAEQAKDNVYFTAVLGEYDVAAIKYGYSVVADETPTYKSDMLDDLAKSTPAFATDEDKMAEQNPYVFTFDMASDPIGYYLDRIELVKKLRKGMLDRYVKEGDSWKSLWQTEKFFLGYTNYIARNLARFIGGVSVKHEHRYEGSTAPTVTYISAEEQARVLTFISSVLAGDEELFPPANTHSLYLDSSGECAAGMSWYCYASKLADVDEVIQRVRMESVANLLNPGVLAKLTSQDVNANMDVRSLLMIVGEAVFTNPTSASNFNVQMIYMSYLTQLSQWEDSRIGTEATLALMMRVGEIQQLLQNPEDLPAEALVHFSKFAQSAGESVSENASALPASTIKSIRKHALELLQA